MSNLEIQAANSFALSVIIPTYNRTASVKRLLQALRQQSVSPVEYEVIVVMDGAPAGEQQALAQGAVPYMLRVLQQPHRGRAAARNTGLQAAAGSLVVFLDDDMEPTLDLLAAHQRAHTAGARLGIMGAVPIETDQSSTPVARYIAAKFNQHLDRLARQGQVLTVRDFYSGNFSIRREVLLEVDGFDEAFRLYGNEDLELAVRLTRAGVQLKYEPAAQARQHYDKDFTALAHDNYDKGQTAVQLAAKHPQVYAQLKLSTYQQVSPRWRKARLGLLALSRWFTPTPALLMYAVQLLEHLPGVPLDLVYRFATDYFFWLGAAKAQAGKRSRLGAEPVNEGLGEGP